MIAVFVPLLFSPGSAVPAWGQSRSAEIRVHWCDQYGNVNCGDVGLPEGGQLHLGAVRR